MSLPELTVREVMDREPVTVLSDCPVRDVLAVMNDRRIGSVLIVTPDGSLAGIFTDRDLLKRVGEATPGWRDAPVSNWMTTRPHTIEPHVGWDEAVERMGKLRVRHLPVIEDGRVVGIVSARMLMARRTEYLNRRVEERTTELRGLNDQLLARDSEILQYLRAAGRLQTKVMLPQSPPDWPHLRWAIHYAPLDHLGGDYYDFAAPGPDQLGVLIADASGHSIPAALVAILARFAFTQAAFKTPNPGDVLSAMNRYLLELIEERFVTAFYGVLDRTTGTFRYATAGHPPPLLFEAQSGKVRTLTGQGFLLGIMPDEVYTQREVQLEPGDKLLFYTDGLIEARNEIGELYGNTRLERCLTLYGGATSAELLAQVLACQRTFCGSEPLTDDLTIVVAEVVP
jgi:phosphoserine phosphatase RsbU/P